MLKKIFLLIMVTFYLTGCAAAYLDGTTPTDSTTIGSACQQPDSSSSHK